MSLTVRTRPTSGARTTGVGAEADPGAMHQSVDGPVPGVVGDVEVPSGAAAVPSADVPAEALLVLERPVVPVVVLGTGVTVVLG